MFRCLVGAAHRVVLVTFTLACGFLSLLKHLPHTHLLTIALKQQRQTKKRSRTSVTFSSLAWADASSFVSKIQFHGHHSSYLSHRTRIRSNRSSWALSTLGLFQMFSTRKSLFGCLQKTIVPIELKKMKPFNSSKSHRLFNLILFHRWSHRLFPLY